MPPPCTLQYKVLYLSPPDGGAVSTPIREEQDYAKETLAYIRQTMESASTFTAVSGWGLMAVGLIGLLAALAAWRTGTPTSLEVWVTAALLSVGATVLGALLGRKAVSAGTLGRATTAARSASRIGREGEDVERAAESHAVLEQRLAELQRELEAETARLGAAFDPATVALRRVALAPRKSDVSVGEVALVWAPWRPGADGFPAPAWS